MSNFRLKLTVLTLGILLVIGMIACANNIDIHNIAFKTIIEELQNRITILEGSDGGESHLVYPQKWTTGDGTVENPWANDCINTAYNNCPAGGTIFLKAGHYQLTGLLTVIKQVNIIGEGRNKAIIVTADASGILVNDVDYCTLKDFTIDAGTQTGQTENVYAIRVQHSDYTTLENIETKDSGYYGITLLSNNYSLLRNIYSHSNYRHGVHPGSNRANRNQYNTYENIYCWNNESSGFNESGGVSFNALGNIYNNLRCWDNGSHGISLYTLKDGTLINSWVYNNGSRGLDLKWLYNFTIENCFVYSSSGLGIWLRNCDNVNLSNVISKNNGTSEITNDGGMCIGDTPTTRLSLCQFYDDRDLMLQEHAIKTEGVVGYIWTTNCKLMPNRLSAIRNTAGAEIKQWPSDGGDGDLAQLTTDFNALLARIQAASEAINK